MAIHATFLAETPGQEGKEYGVQVESVSVTNFWRAALEMIPDEYLSKASRLTLVDVDFIPEE